MKRPTIILALAAMAILALAGTSSAAGGKLKCFTGTPASCAVDGDTATLDMSSGGYAGAYYSNGKSLGGSTLSSVDFTFHGCDPSDDTTTCVGGGSPRWSIPIDTDGDGKTDAYAFVDAANCGSTGVVSTTLSTCPVFLNTGGSWANWDAFAAAKPGYGLGRSLPFVITDTTEPGTRLIFGIVIAS